MPSLETHQASNLTKMMLLGDSGTGKTGSLISLVEEGYFLRILDLDNGLDILANLARGSTKRRKDGLSLLQAVDFITVSNKYKQAGGKPVVVDASAWPRTMGYLNQWTNLGEAKRDPATGETIKIKKPPLRPGGAEITDTVKITKEDPEFFDLGKPENWGPNTILVVDSFSSLCMAALKYTLHINGRPAGPIQESDWGSAQQLIEDFLDMLYGREFNTNFILIAHILYRDLGLGTKGYPNALGKALPPKVGRYVNSMLEVARTGTGAAATRKIHTVPHGLLDLKNPNPIKVKAEYPIATGLAEFFAAVRTA